MPVVPPSDLLSRVQGVESTLRRGKRLGAIGWAAFLVSVVEVSALVFTSGWWQGLGDLEWSGLDDDWPIVASTLLLILSVLLINWTRVWVRESRAPFRYTFSIDAFQPLDGSEPEPRLLWLREDLSERLSQRIGRLSLLSEEEAAAGESHVHIEGSYGIRRASDGGCAIEVFPWIRLGPRGAPATLAHPVKFHLPQGEDELRGEEGARAYEKLLERIYFSIATHLYGQIRRDVLRKIELLPKRYFRAAAYFYEAEDYVRSNTLDAYREAEELYAEVVKLYDPTWSERGHSAFRRFVKTVGRLLGTWALYWRRVAAKAWPRLGRVELMVARAETGYANTLLYRRALAGLSGQRLNPIFEARPVAQSAVDRLDGLGSDVPGRDSALFDGLVTLANAHASLGALDEAEPSLEQARQRDPARAEQDARFLYVRGRVVPRQQAQFFLRAIELEPTFEVAQFELALAVEKMWRRRRTLEPNVADMIADEYERVLTLNPGNIAAWASLGYMQWLLAGGDSEEGRRIHLDEAEQFLERGREYKEIKRETFVAELDYGLARIAAERGDFKRAYRRYIEAVSAHFAQGVSHAPDGYTASHFEGITPFILGRFDAYRRRVRELWEQGRQESRDDATSRIRDSVYAFVLNDFGEACLNYFLRSGDFRYLDHARDALLEAERELKARYPMLSYNLNRLQRWEADFLDGERMAEALRSPEEKVESVLLDTGYIQRVIRYEPYWPDGRLEMAQSDLTRAQQALWAADEIDQRAEKHEVGAQECEQQASQKELEATDVHRLPELPWSILLEETMRGMQKPLATAAVPTTAVTSLADALRQRPPLAREVPELGPQLDGEAMLREASILRQRAVGERGEATRLRDLAGRLRDEAAEGARRAADVPKTLLPHEWLWKEGSFDWEVLERKDLIRQRSWEREFDDLHVRALFALYKSSARVESGSHEVAEPGYVGEAEETRADAWRLLEHLRKHFWPSDFQLLRECRRRPALTENDREEFDAKLRSHVEIKARADPAFSTLYWVAYFTFSEDRLFEPVKASELLRSAVDERDLPEFLYSGLGFWLYELTDEAFELGMEERTACRKSALKAFERGARSEDSALLFLLAQELEARGHWEESLEVYRSAKKRDERALSPAHDPDEYQRAMGRALWKLGRHRLALPLLEAVTGTVPGVGDGWRTALVDELLRDGSLTSVWRYRLLKNWLGRRLTAAQNAGDERTRTDAATALLRLTQALYQRLVRRPLDPEVEESVAAMMPIAAPIVLEAHTDLLPEAETLQPVEMRRQILREIGVELHQISVLASTEVGERRYRLHLGEVPLEEGEFAPEERWFAPDGEEARRRGLEGHEGPNPLGGLPGLWLDGDETLDAEEGIEQWDRYTFMLKHAQSLLLSNLTFQQLDHLVEAWEAASPNERRPLRESALPDEEARIRLASILRALLAEGVSVLVLVDRLAAILRTVATVDSKVGTHELKERVRFELRATLPGTEGWRRLVVLPPELEDEIADWTTARDGQRFLALPLARLESLRRDLRKQVPGDVDEGRSAIVVLTPGLRPFVHELVAFEYPRLPVVAFIELPEGRRLAGEQRPAGAGVVTSL